MIEAAPFAKKEGSLTHIANDEKIRSTSLTQLYYIWRQCKYVYSDAMLPAARILPFVRTTNLNTEKRLLSTVKIRHQHRVI